MNKNRNIAKCRNCGDIIESIHRHDFVACKCFVNEEHNKGIAIDGGKDYIRRVGEPDSFMEPTEEEIRLFDIKNKIRETHCPGCGSQRCGGQDEWIKGCGEYKKMAGIENNTLTPEDIKRLVANHFTKSEGKSEEISQNPEESHKKHYNKPRLSRNDRDTWQIDKGLARDSVENLRKAVAEVSKPSLSIAPYPLEMGDGITDCDTCSNTGQIEYGGINFSCPDCEECEVVADGNVDMRQRLKISEMIIKNQLKEIDFLRRAHNVDTRTIKEKHSKINELEKRIHKMEENAYYRNGGI